MNGLVFRECKHIKNIFEDVYFTKNSFHITLIQYNKFYLEIRVGRKQTIITKNMKAIKHIIDQAQA